MIPKNTNMYFVGILFESKECEDIDKVQEEIKIQEERRKSLQQLNEKNTKEIKR